MYLTSIVVIVVPSIRDPGTLRLIGVATKQDPSDSALVHNLPTGLGFAGCETRSKSCEADAVEGLLPELSRDRRRRGRR